MNNIKKVFEANKGKSSNIHMIQEARTLDELDKFRKFLSENEIDNREIWLKLKNIENAVLGK